MIVAASTVESSLMARRLMRWGARVCVAPDAAVAAALLPERAWGAMFADHAIGRAACDALAQASETVPQRFVLVTPTARAELRGAERGRLHRLSGQTDPRGIAGDADGERRRRIRAPRRHRRGGRRGDTESGLEGPRDLIAEDNEINALLATLALLTRLGHRPTVATNGDAAVDAWLRRGKPASPTRSC